MYLSFKSCRKLKAELQTKNTVTIQLSHCQAFLHFNLKNSLYHIWGTVSSNEPLSAFLYLGMF